MRLKTPAVSQEDLVQAIAWELRPWTCPEAQVLTTIRGEIARFQTDQGKRIPEVGHRSENKQYAEDLLAILHALDEQIDRVPRGFFCRRDESVEEFDVPDRFHGNREIEFTSLRAEVIKWAEYCKETIRDPAGCHPHTKFLENSIAANALCLMFELSTKEPIVGNPDRSSFCQIASLLFEAVTGKPKRGKHPLLRACRKMLSCCRQRIAAGIRRELETSLVRDLPADPRVRTLVHAIVTARGLPGPLCSSDETQAAWARAIVARIASQLGHRSTLQRGKTTLSNKRS